MCYANSVTQVLFHLAPLRVQLLQAFELAGRPEPAEPRGKAKVTPRKATLLYNLGVWMNESLRAVPSPLSIKWLMEYIGTINEQYKSLEQQDAQEFMLWILNQLSDELKKFKLPNVSSPYNQHCCCI